MKGCGNEAFLTFGVKRGCVSEGLKSFRAWFGKWYAGFFTCVYDGMRAMMFFTIQRENRGVSHRSE